MSALDQAFIKAYTKDAPAPIASSGILAALSPHAGARSRSPSSPAQADRPGIQIENVYANGALYRLETVSSTESPAAAEQYSPPAREQRTAQRRVPARLRPASEPQKAVTPPPAETTTRPARRLPVRSLSEVARRLSRKLPLAPSSELPPEVLIVEEPAAVPTAPPAPAAPPVPAPTNATHDAADSTSPAKVDEPAAIGDKAEPVISEQQTVAADAVARPDADNISSTPAPAEPMDWLTDDVATLVEVCTPWESINDAVSGSLVILTDSPALYYEPTVPPPTTSAVVDTAPEADPLESAPIPAQALASAEEPVAPADAEPASDSKTFRLDPPASEAIAPPHFEAAQTDESQQDREDQPLPIEPSLASASFAELSAEETASLIGAVPEEPVEPPLAAAATPAQAPDREPLLPMWEVDRFQWPGICDRLLKDDQSYFAQAGGKLVAAAKDGLKTLGITGSRRGEGRTTLALCLARCAAQSGLNVALIDADFARPQLASVIGLEVAYGWQDAARGKIPLAEAAVKSLADMITVLPLEASSAAWPLTMSDKRVSAVIRGLTRTHDLVIVDMGPTSTGGESVFAPDEAAPLDAVIVLRDLRYATAAETQAIGERLSASGVEAVGIAENFVPPAKKPGN